MRKNRTLALGIALLFLVNLCLGPCGQTAYAAGASDGAAAQAAGQLDKFIDVFQLIKNYYVNPVDDQALIDGAIEGMLSTLSDAAEQARLARQASNVKPGENGELERFKQVLQLVKDNCAGRVDEKALITGAIEGMLRTLDDPYSVYMETNQYQKFSQEMQGSFGGIGVKVVMRDGCLIVAEPPLEGTPASRAALKAGDRILAVDGKDISGLSPDEAVGLIRGEVGTKVVLTIMREGQEAPFTVELVRETIELKNLTSDLLDGDLGYIKLKEFDGKSPREFNQALIDLRSKGAKGLILDLRDNPGGLLTSAAFIACNFVPEGEPIIHAKGRDGVKKTYASLGPQGGGVLWDKPLAVLVNGNSASAAEILAGIIQDYGIGKLVGTRTYGKGTMQGVKNYPDGSAVKLTVKEYFTPKEHKVNRIGLMPDIPVGDENLQLERAIEVLKPVTQKTVEMSVGADRAKVNGRDVKVDAAPYLENGHTLVPLRFLAEALGAKVDWDGGTQRVTLTLDGKEISLTIGSASAAVNGTAVKLEAPCVIKGGRTMIPLRFVGESLGASVEWNPGTQNIKVAK